MHAFARVRGPKISLFFRFTNPNIMTSRDAKIQAAKHHIEYIPDFPIPGIVFQNLFPVLRNPTVFKDLVDVLVEDIRTQYPDVEAIVGLESRGFLFGPVIALALGVAFIPVRKKGKLPGETIRQDYQLEYGTDTFEIQKNSVREGLRVVIVDDLLATGGTMEAACRLMESARARVLACMVVIELKALKGKDKLKYPLMSYIE